MDLVGRKAFFLDNFRQNLPLWSVGHGQISSRVELCLLLCLAVLSDDVTLVEKFPAWMQKNSLVAKFCQSEISTKIIYLDYSISIGY